MTTWQVQQEKYQDFRSWKTVAARDVPQRLVGNGKQERLLEGKEGVLCRKPSVIKERPYLDTRKETRKGEGGVNDNS